MRARARACVVRVCVRPSVRPCVRVRASCDSVCRWLRYEVQLCFSQEQQAIEWFILRVIFLREYGISIHFDFSKYARKSLTNSIMHGVRITPGTWAFMLFCLLLFAGADLVRRLDYVGAINPPVEGRDRRFLAVETGQDEAKAKAHIVIIAGISWCALFLQMLIVLLLRQRLRLLLQVSPLLPVSLSLPLCFSFSLAEAAVAVDVAEEAAHSELL